jgi:hypothetical protein
LIVNPSLKLFNAGKIKRYRNYNIRFALPLYAIGALKKDLGAGMISVSVICRVRVNSSPTAASAIRSRTSSLVVCFRVIFSRRVPSSDRFRANCDRGLAAAPPPGSSYNTRILSTGRKSI